MPEVESAQPGACTPGQGWAREHTGGAPKGVGNAGLKPSFGQTLWGVNPPHLLQEGWEGGQVGGLLLPPPPQQPISMRQDRPSICSHWKITLNFQKGKQSVNLSLSDTHLFLCSKESGESFNFQAGRERQ